MRERQPSPQEAQTLTAMGMMAKGLAHEFNNLLAVIRNNTEIVMAMDLTEESPAHKHLRLVLQAAERACSLVQNLSTLDENSPRQRLHLQPLLKAALQRLKAALPQPLAIQVVIDPNVGPVLADPVELHQLLFSLFDQALAAMGQGGGRLEVRLAARRLEAQALALPRPQGGRPLPPGVYAELRVGYTPGDPAPKSGDHPSALSPLGPPQALSPGADTVKHPTAMRVPALARKIAKALGGAVAGEPPSAVGGAALLVWLPSLTAATVEAAAADPVPTVAGTILLVDDEPGIVTFAERLLGQRGYQLQTASTSEQALELFRQSPETFRLVISDLSLSGMNGLELAAAIWAIAPRTPILLLTGSDDNQTAQRAAALGIRRLLIKPIRAAQLIDAVHACLAPERRPREVDADDRDPDRR